MSMQIVECQNLFSELFNIFESSKCDCRAKKSEAKNVSRYSSKMADEQRSYRNQNPIRVDHNETNILPTFNRFRDTIRFFIILWLFFRNCKPVFFLIFSYYFSHFLVLFLWKLSKFRFLVMWKKFSLRSITAHFINSRGYWPESLG